MAGGRVERLDGQRADDVDEHRRRFSRRAGNDAEWRRRRHVSSLAAAAAAAAGGGAGDLDPPQTDDALTDAMVELLVA